MSTHPQDEQELDGGSCPGCGLDPDLWTGPSPKGFIDEAGERYCCEACAQGEICACGPKSHRERESA